MLVGGLLAQDIVWGTNIQTQAITDKIGLGNA